MPKAAKSKAPKAEHKAEPKHEPKPEPKAEPKHEAEPEQHGPRPFWSGTVSFGLVSVPVDLYPATRGGGNVSLRMLAPDGTPLRREYVCPKHDRPLERDEIVRALELDLSDNTNNTEHELVVLTDAELEALAPDSSRDIEIRQFVPLSELSPLMFERPYFLLPSSSALKPYRLLAQVLEQRGRAGIASFVMRGHQHMAAILAEGGLLRIETLRFGSQLRSPEQIGLPEPPKSVDEELLDQFNVAIDELAADELDPSELEDETVAGTIALAKKKRAEGRDIVESPSPEPGAEAEIIDLMEILQRSVALPG